MKKLLHTSILVASAVCVPHLVRAQQPALLITRINPQPPTQANNEYVELIATRSINFATEPYTVIAVQIGGSTIVSNGWITGGGVTYAIEINSGSISQGELIYVGGNSFTVNGTNCKKVQVNTNNNSIAGIGNGNSGGVFGDGGGQQDGIGIFAGAASSIAASSTPIDALFYGTAGAYGSQVSGMFKVPANDLYGGGYAGNPGNTYLGPNPTSTNYVLTATAGTFYTNTSAFGTARSFSSGNATPNCGYTPGLTLALANTLSIAAGAIQPTSLISLPGISGVVGDPGDPAADSGFVLSVLDNNIAIPAASYTLTASSSNTAVLPNSGIAVTKADGSARVRLNPAAAGYSTVTLTLTKGSDTKTFTVDYAASAAASSPATAFFHTGFSDGSGAIALDSAYMLVVDDENNKLNVYYRWQSGLPVKTYDYGGIAGLNLADLSGGVPREIDLEATERSLAVPDRIYFMGSYSNQSTGSYNARPNRNRLFALNVTGTGAATAFSYIGDYESLKSDLLSWGATNGLGLSASAAANKDPKAIDGFNIEGMAFAPDSTTLYVAFRAPLEPTTNRVNALIAPIANFESYFGTGSPGGSPTIGTPILLDLGGRGFRDLVRIGPNQYVILAGDYGESNIPSAVYRWNGNAANAPVLLSGFNVTGLNPEGALPVYRNGVLQANQLQLVSDNGATAFYGDGIAAKDLATNAFKKFRSDLVTSPGSPLPLVFTQFDASYAGAGRVQLSWTSNPGSATHFVLERSMNGADFSRAADIIAQAGRREYAFTDEVGGSEVWFYRIRAVEGNGEGFLTNVKMVRIPGNETGIRLRALNGGYQLELPAEGMKQITVSNTAGQRVGRFLTAGQSFVLPLQAQPAGIYFLEIQTAAGLTRMKLCK